MRLPLPFVRAAAVASALGLLAACSSTDSVLPDRRADYRQAKPGAQLELPPDLTTSTIDDTLKVPELSPSGQASLSDYSRERSTVAGGVPRAANVEKVLAQPDGMRIEREGERRWLVLKAAPEQVWPKVKEFWTSNGFLIKREDPRIGLLETDWAENRADIPADALRRTLGQFADIFYTTYRRDKYRTRVERGAEQDTVEIYVSHRGMEQVPTTKIDNSSPAAFAWALMPPNPDLEAEMLTRLMVRFGSTEPQAIAAVAQAAAQPDRARIEKGADGVPKLVVDETFDRAWRRVGLALDRTGFTVVDRDRSTGVYYVRYADPDSEIGKKDQGWIAKLAFWRKDEGEKPEQYRIAVVEALPSSVVTVQDTKGAPDKSPASDRILALLKDQLK